MSASKIAAKKKLKRLLHKSSYLRLEIEERSEELKEHERQFEKSYWEESEEQEEKNIEQSSDHKTVIIDQSGEGPDSIGSHSDTEPAPEEISSADPPPEEMRSLWKQIAFKTHPDKTGGDPELSEAYKKASDAYSSGRFDELLDLALTLSIELEDPSDALIALLEKRVQALEENLDSISKNVLWDWAVSPPEKKKKIEQALRSHRKRKKSKK
jgi:hypothetical protein